MCLDCGKHFSMLKRHLMTDHKLTPDQDPRAMGASGVVPDRRTELCQDPICAGEEVRIGSEGCRAEEDG